MQGRTGRLISVGAGLLASLAGALVFALPGGAAPVAGNDACGYPSTSFTESTVMRWGQLNGTGLNSQIVAFGNDEKGLLLGVNGATTMASATSNGANSKHSGPYSQPGPSNPQGGSLTAVDSSGRFFYPALYITDQTTANSPTKYDFQNGGTPRNISGSGQPFVDDIFGAWSTATGTENPATHQLSNYTVTPPPAKNDWNLGSGSDTPVGTTFAAMGDEGYGAEVRWNVNELTDGAGNALKPGDTYRIQIIEHDGDQNKTGGDAGEFCLTLTIPKQPSSMTTSATDQSGTPGTVGDTIKDTATITGANPTGTVTFNLYSDANCTNLVHSETDALNGGQATTATGFKTTSTGTYYWVDTYSGDSANTGAGPFPGAPGTAACSSDPKEQSVVNPGHPGLNTTASDRAASPGTVGDTVTDTATVVGMNPTGTVTFRLYSDPNCTNLVYGPDTETLSGGQATASPGFTTSNAGTYYWVDTYSGDANNTAAGPFPGAPGSSACSSDTNEQSVVGKAPTSMTTSATHQAGSPGTVGDTITDTASVTGHSPTGTVTFRLYSDSSCTNLVYFDTEPLSGGLATASGYTTAAAGTYYWVDTYSGDSNNAQAGPFPGLPGTASCSSDPKEQSTVKVAPAPDMSVLKLASVHCADLASGATEPLGLTPGSCTATYGVWTPFSHGTWTLEVPRPGQAYAKQIDYEIQVQNLGNTPLALTISDPECDQGTIHGPFLVSGSLIGTTLSSGGAAFFTCSHTLTENDPDLNASGQPFANTATVFGTVPGGPTIHHSSTVTVDRRPQVLPFCRAKRGPRKGHKVFYRRGHFPKACLKPHKPKPPTKPPKNPSGFTG